MSLSHKPISEMETMDYEERGDVGLWILKDFAGHFESENMEEGEKHYRKTASDDRMNATVVIIEDAENLGAEIRNSLDHINEEWSALSDSVGVDRIAYVADGIMSSAVESKIEADVETGSFDEIDEAVEWCQEVQ